MRKGLLGAAIVAMACGVAGFAFASDDGGFPFPKMKTKNCVDQDGAAINCFAKNWPKGSIVSWKSKDDNLVSVTTREKATPEQASEGIDYVMVTRDDEGKTYSAEHFKDAERVFKCWGGPDAGCGMEMVRTDR